MKCEIIRDLLPLYAAGGCSTDSAKLVETHIKLCPACAAALHRMARSEFSANVEAREHFTPDVKALRRAYAKRAREKWTHFILPITLVALILVWVCGAVFAWCPWMHRYLNPWVREHELLAGEFVNDMNWGNFHSIQDYRGTSNQEAYQWLQKVAKKQVAIDQEAVDELIAKGEGVFGSIYEEAFKKAVRTFTAGKAEVVAHRVTDATFRRVDMVLDLDINRTDTQHDQLLEYAIHLYFYNRKVVAIEGYVLPGQWSEGQTWEEDLTIRMPEVFLSGAIA